MKRLIFLFDGTWNSAATGRFVDITNIFRMNLAISRSATPDIPQITFYAPGPGNRGVFDKEMGGLFGQGLDQIIREAYVNLSSNYEDHDEILIFGYSRGSIAARALTCLIAESGLLKPQQLHRLASVWNRFIDINSGKISSEHPSEVHSHVHRNVRIKFVGLFDSVLGRGHKSPNRFSQLVFKNNTVSPIVDRGVHILSIDDNKKIFKPMIWGARESKQKIEQIWMPGVHSDIGGYGVPNLIGISSLLTMISKVKSTGVAFNQHFLDAMIRKIEEVNNMEIRSEREDIFGKILRSACRTPGDSQHLEKKHPLLDAIYNKKFIVKRRRRAYNHKYLSPFLELEPEKNEYTDLIINSVEAAIART
ncbi:DUF2235 domain-containing protein [Methylobacterium sp. Leaf123]|uniref:phospholipase effector Tle1 domain-containing protein n=1 Tax=Methylobacterium sp. Leaf123 TaxID=1736264 RepID=UPI0009EC79F4|nr:DUF2235 domain-containing protein [Methylobacterium sp. Leaf123]